MFKLPVWLAAIVFSNCILGGGIICGAIAADNPQISSSQPSTLNLQQLPTLIEIPQTPESIEKVLKLEEEGENLFKQRMLEKALAKWQEAYGMSLEMKYSEGEGRALTNMGRVFLEHGQFVKAKYMGENAIEVLASSPDKKALGRAHLYLAQAYFGLDNPLWAGEQLDQAMKIFSSDSSNNAADTARLMTIASSVLLKMSKLKEAVQFLQAAAMYSAQAGDNTACISSRIQVVNVLLALGLLTAAEEESEKAVSVARTAPDQIANLAAALSAQANCKVALGEYLAAEKLYEQVLSDCKNIPKEQLNNFGRANIYLGYGTTLSALHKYDPAKQALEFALPVFKAAGASYPQSQTGNNLGIVEEDSGHQTKAKELLEQALDLHNLIVPKQEPFRVSVLNNLACVEGRLGQNTEARAHLSSAAEQLKKAKEYTLLGRVETNLADIALKLSEQTEAERLLGEAMKFSQQVNDDSSLWRQYVFLAKVQITQNNVKLARESMLSAASFLRSPQSGLFASPEHIDYLTTRKDAAYQLISMLVEQKFYEQAFMVCEQIKQESFLVDWYSHTEQLPSGDNDLYNDLVTQRAHLHAAEVSSPPDRIVKEWQQWQIRFRSLATENKSLAHLIMPIPVPLTEILHAAQASHSLILDYFLGQDSTILFIVGGNNKINAVVLNTNEKQITGQVNSLIAALSQTSNNPADTALASRLLHTLSNELLPPSVQTLLIENNPEQLTIVPHESLANLPFAALINDKNKYLISSYALTYADTAAAILDNPPRYSDTPNFLFVSGTESGEDLQPIASALPSSAVTCLNGESNLKNVQEQLRAKTAVHISNKVELNFDSFSSLLSDCQLPCDLFILSNTQLDKSANYNKDIMATTSTFARRCQIAGARNVIINLWYKPVNDSTKQWQGFYANLNTGLSPAAALRKTLMSMITDGTPPSEWAMLQLYGVGY